jgi:hypothetical protein
MTTQPSTTRRGREGQSVTDTYRLLNGPPLPRVTCPTCEGRGFTLLNPVRPRECPTCRGGGQAVRDARFSDGFDFRTYQLGLAPREAAAQPHQQTETESGR